MASPNRTTSLATVSATTLGRAGRVIALTCFNGNAASRHLLLFDQASGAPSGATNLVLSFLIPAGSQIIIGTDFFGPSGLTFSSGITWGVSTAHESYTAGTASDHTTTILYQEGL